MDPHSSWFVFFPGHDQLLAFLRDSALILGEDTAEFRNAKIVVQHLIGAVCVLVFLLLGAARSSSYFKSTPVPTRKFGLVLVYDAILGVAAGMCKDLIGTEEWKRYFPLISTLGLFILFSNLMGLIPGFVPPTDNLETTAVCAVIVFVYYWYHSIRRNGWGPFIHMANPAGLGWTWVMAPFMFAIEAIGHLARPVSLALRLRGNMVGDHAVIAAFAGIIPVLLPLPFMVMGLLVCTLQAYVFCMLTSIYIGMGVEHAEH
jgi:F-type H+-transporting ATPase subunit a